MVEKKRLVFMLSITTICVGLLSALWFIFKKQQQTKNGPVLNTKSVTFHPSTKTHDGQSKIARSMYLLVMKLKDWSQFPCHERKVLFDTLQNTVVKNRVDQLNNGAFISENDHNQVTYIYGPNCQIIPCDVALIHSILNSFNPKS